MFKVNKKITRKSFWGFLLSTLNIFHTFFQCFHRWLWTSKCLLGTKRSNNLKLVYRLLTSNNKSTTLNTSTHWIYFWLGTCICLLVTFFICLNELINTNFLAKLLSPIAITLINSGRRRRRRRRRRWWGKK